MQMKNSISSPKSLLELLAMASSPKLRLSRSLARIRSPSLRSKPSCDSLDRDQKIEFLGSVDATLESFGDGDHDECEKGNNVMVVIDSSNEAKGALEWALSHAVQSKDNIVLLYVTKPSKRGPNLKVNMRAYKLLHSLKTFCQRRRPGVQVEAAIREGKDKGPTVVEEAKQQRVSLLVLGQRKRWSMCRIIERWTGKKNRSGAVEYCIQNSSCMTIAVRRKGKRHGGYLITTKRHKNFWLLA